MLEINPNKRITAEEALAHPYLESLHDEADEPKFNGNINFEFENDQNIKLETLREMILQEVNYYKGQNKEKAVDIGECMKVCAKREALLKVKLSQKKE